MWGTKGSSSSLNLSWKTILEREAIRIQQPTFAGQCCSQAAPSNQLIQGVASESIWFSMDIFGTLQRTNRIGSKRKELERAKNLPADKNTLLFEVLFWNAWIDPLGGFLAHLMFFFILPGISFKSLLDFLVRRAHKEYYMDRDLLFYRLRIPKESYQYLMGHKIIEEKGKYENGKQWVHLHKTNVKSRATLTTHDKKENLMWTGELLSKDDMEAMAWQIDPSWGYPAKLLKGVEIKSSPFDPDPSAPAGIWSSR